MHLVRGWARRRTEADYRDRRGDVKCRTASLRPKNRNRIYPRQSNRMLDLNDQRLVGFSTFVNSLRVGNRGVLYTRRVVFR